MKLRYALHIVCGVVCLALLFAGQGRLAAVLYALCWVIELSISVVTGKQGNDTER
jgi:hypothetical protein